MGLPNHILPKIERSFSKTCFITSIQVYHHYLSERGIIFTISKFIFSKFCSLTYYVNIYIYIYIYIYKQLIASYNLNNTTLPPSEFKTIPLKREMTLSLRHQTLPLGANKESLTLIKIICF